MADGARPIQSRPGWSLTGGTQKGAGVVLLYPDKLASVRVCSELWGYFLGPLVLGAAIYPIASALGPLTAAIGALLGGTIGRAVDRWRAARAVAGHRKRTTIIPLDTVTTVQAIISTGFGGWLGGNTLIVTTADGIQYVFRGRAARLQPGIASALAGLGHEVRATPQGLAVTPRARGQASGSGT